MRASRAGRDEEGDAYGGADVCVCVCGSVRET